MVHSIPGPDCSLSALRESGGERPPGMEPNPGVFGDNEGLGDLRLPLRGWHPVLLFLLDPVSPLLAQTGRRWDRRGGNEPAHALLPGSLRKASQGSPRNQDIRLSLLTHVPKPSPPTATQDVLIAPCTHRWGPHPPEHLRWLVHIGSQISIN